MKRIIHTLPNGGVAISQPAGQRSGENEAVWLDRVARKCGPKGSRFVALVDTADLPATHEHREAWVWDGQRVVVDTARIKPPAPAAAPAGAVVARDPRVDALGSQLADQIASAFHAMKAEFDHKLDAIRTETSQEIAVEHQRSIEALWVHSALKDEREINPGGFPALERMLRDAGREVTPSEIIAAADEQARRSSELAGGL